MTASINQLDHQIAVTVVDIPTVRDQDGEARSADAPPGANWEDELLLRRASLLLAASRDAAELRECAIRLPLPCLADWCALHLAVTAPASDSSPPPRILCAHVDPYQELRARMLWQRAVQAAPDVIPAFARVLRAHEEPAEPVRLAVDLERISSDTSSSPQVRLLERVGLATAVHVPLVAEARALGVLTFASVRAGRYGPRQVALAIAYASQAALVLVRAQCLPRLMEPARLGSRERA